MHTAIATIAQRFPRDRASRRALTLGVGQICGYGIQLAAIPILTRLYAPDEFGLLALFSGIVGIGAVAITLRYEAAIPLAENDRQAVHLLFVTIGLSLAGSALLACAVLPLSGALLSGTETSRLEPFIALIAFSIAAGGIYQGLTHWLLQQHSFGRLMMARVVLSAGTACCQVGLALVMSGSSGLILGYAVGYALACLTIGMSPVRERSSRCVSIREAYTAAGQFRRFPQFGVWGALINAAAVHLPAILYSALFGPMAAGLYLLAHRCLAVPMSLLHYPLSRVFLSEAARLIRRRPAALAAIYRQALGRILLIAVVPVAVLMVAAPRLFELFFGPEWTVAGAVCRNLAPLLLAQLAWTCVQSTLDVLKRQDLDLLFSGIHAGLIVVALLAGSWCGASITTTAALMSICGAAGYSLSLWLTWRLILKSVNGVPPSDAPVTE